MASLNQMPALMMVLVVIGASAGIGAVVMTKIADQVNDSTTTTIANNTKSALNDSSTWLGTIVVVLFGAFVIGILLRSFSGTAV